MQITKVVYVNLQSRGDRLNNILASLETSGVPNEVIAQHLATNASDYRTFDELCGAAIADGYGDRFKPYFVTPPYLDADYWWVGIGDLACVWTKLRLYNRLRGEENTTLIVEDDCVLQRSFDDIQASIANLDADIVQLGYTSQGASLMPAAAFQDGFGGLGEYALILTAAGAQVLYDLLLYKSPDESFHLDELVKDKAQDFERVVSVTDPSAWVTRRPEKDSDRINATIADWQANADVYLADGVAGAAERNAFIAEYQSGG